MRRTFAVHCRARADATAMAVMSAARRCMVFDRAVAAVMAARVASYGPTAARRASPFLDQLTIHGCFQLRGRGSEHSLLQL